jgi:hypothetical protein
MKLQLVVFLLVCNVSFSQDWMGEIMVGASAYNGDLTQQAFSFKRINPAFGFNIKYNTGDFLNIRAGIAFEKVSANDKDNKSPFLQARNLNFKTNILEFDLSFEFVLLDPEVYDAYPYLFAGMGIFHFNPYTYDDNGAKTYLHPLSTEGEGLPDFGRKNYSLIQPCVPVGAGFKYKFNKKFEACFEFGYRWLFTDYLDDVSKTYVNLEILSARKGPEAAALSYRKVGVPFSEEGYPRGNPKVKDYYWFSGFKLAYKLNKK